MSVIHYGDRVSLAADLDVGFGVVTPGADDQLRVVRAADLSESAAADSALVLASVDGREEQLGVAVHFFDTVRLVHQTTQRYLSVRSRGAASGHSVVELVPARDTPQRSTLFRIVPCSQYHRAADEAQLGDDIYLVGVKSALALHVSTSSTLTADEELQTISTVGAGLQHSVLRFNAFSVAGVLRNQMTLQSGSLIMLRFPATQTCLAFGNVLSEPSFSREVYGDDRSTASKLGLTLGHSDSLWEVLLDGPADGLVLWRQTIRLRHVPTRRFLAVEGERWSVDADRAGSDPACAFELHPVDEADGFAVFDAACHLRHVASSRWLHLTDDMLDPVSNKTLRAMRYGMINFNNQRKLQLLDHVLSRDTVHVEIVPSVLVSLIQPVQVSMNTLVKFMYPSTSNTDDLAEGYRRRRRRRAGAHGEATDAPDGADDDDDDDLPEQHASITGHGSSDDDDDDDDDDNDDGDGDDDSEVQPLESAAHPGKGRPPRVPPLAETAPAVLSAGASVATLSSTHAPRASTSSTGGLMRSPSLRSPRSPRSPVVPRRSAHSRASPRLAHAGASGIGSTGSQSGSMRPHTAISHFITHLASSDDSDTGTRFSIDFVGLPPPVGASPSAASIGLGVTAALAAGTAGASAATTNAPHFGAELTPVSAFAPPSLLDRTSAPGTPLSGLPTPRVSLASYPASVNPDEFGMGPPPQRQPQHQQATAASTAGDVSERQSTSATTPMTGHLQARTLSGPDALRRARADSIVSGASMTRVVLEALDEPSSAINPLHRVASTDMMATLADVMLPAAVPPKQADISEPTGIAGASVTAVLRAIRSLTSLCNADTGDRPRIVQEYLLEQGFASLLLSFLALVDAECFTSSEIDPRRIAAAQPLLQLVHSLLQAMMHSNPFVSQRCRFAFDYLSRSIPLHGPPSYRTLAMLVEGNAVLARAFSVEKVEILFSQLEDARHPDLLLILRHVFDAAGMNTANIKRFVTTRLLRDYNSLFFDLTAGENHIVASDGTDEVLALDVTAQLDETDSHHSLSSSLRTLVRGVQMIAQPRSTSETPSLLLAYIVEQVRLCGSLARMSSDASSVIASHMPIAFLSGVLLNPVMMNAIPDKLRAALISLVPDLYTSPSRIDLTRVSVKAFDSKLEASCGRITPYRTVSQVAMDVFLSTCRDPTDALLTSCVTEQACVALTMTLDQGDMILEPEAMDEVVRAVTQLISAITNLRDSQYQTQRTRQANAALKANALAALELARAALHRWLRQSCNSLVTDLLASSLTRSVRASAAPAASAARQWQHRLAHDLDRSLVHWDTMQHVVLVLSHGASSSVRAQCMRTLLDFEQRNEFASNYLATVYPLGDAKQTDAFNSLIHEICAFLRLAYGGSTLIRAEQLANVISMLRGSMRTAPLPRVAVQRLAVQTGVLRGLLDLLIIDPLSPSRSEPSYQRMLKKTLCCLRYLCERNQEIVREVVPHVASLLPHIGHDVGATKLLVSLFYDNETASVQVTDRMVSYIIHVLQVGFQKPSLLAVLHALVMVEARCIPSMCLLVVQQVVPARDSALLLFEGDEGRQQRRRAIDALANSTASNITLDFHTFSVALLAKCSGSGNPQVTLACRAAITEDECFAHIMDDGIGMRPLLLASYVRFWIQVYLSGHDKIQQRSRSHLLALRVLMRALSALRAASQFPFKELASSLRLTPEGPLRFLPIEHVYAEAPLSLQCLFEAWIPLMTFWMRRVDLATLEPPKLAATVRDLFTDVCSASEALLQAIGSNVNHIHPAYQAKLRTLRDVATRALRGESSIDASVSVVTLPEAMHGKGRRHMYDALSHIEEFTALARPLIAPLQARGARSAFNLIQSICEDPELLLTFYVQATRALLVKGDFCHGLAATRLLLAFAHARSDWADWVDSPETALNAEPNRKHQRLLIRHGAFRMCAELIGTLPSSVAGFLAELAAALVSDSVQVDKESQASESAAPGRPSKRASRRRGICCRRSTRRASLTSEPVKSALVKDSQDGAPPNKVSFAGVAPPPSAAPGIVEPASSAAAATAAAAAADSAPAGSDVAGEKAAAAAAIAGAPSAPVAGRKARHAAPATLSLLRLRAGLKRTSSKRALGKANGGHSNGGNNGHTKPNRARAARLLPMLFGRTRKDTSLVYTKYAKAKGTRKSLRELVTLQLDDTESATSGRQFSAQLLRLLRLAVDRLRVSTFNRRSDAATDPSLSLIASRRTMVTLHGAPHQSSRLEDNSMTHVHDFSAFTALLDQSRSLRVSFQHWSHMTELSMLRTLMSVLRLIENLSAGAAFSQMKRLGLFRFIDVIDTCLRRLAPVVFNSEPLVRQLFATLNAFVDENSTESQVAFASSGILQNLARVWYLRPSPTNPMSQLLLVQFEVVMMFQNLFDCCEGVPVIANRVALTVPIEALLQALAERASRKRKELSEQEHALQFRIFTLLLRISLIQEHEGLIEQLGRPEFEYLRQRTGSVEIVNLENKLVRVFFQIPSECKYLDLAERKELVRSVATETNPTVALCKNTDLYHFQMRHLARLNKSPTFARVVQSFRFWAYTSFIITLVINSLLMASYTATIPSGTAAFALSIGARFSSAVLGLGIVSLVFFVFRTVVLFIRWSPITIEEGWRRLNARRKRAPTYRPGPALARCISAAFLLRSFQYMFHVLMVVVSALGVGVSVSWYALLLLDLLYLSKPLRAMGLAFTNSIRPLAFTGAVIVVLLFMFAMFEFSIYPDISYNRLQFYYMCDTLAKCFVYYLFYGLRSRTMHDMMDFIKMEDDRAAQRFIFEAFVSVTFLLILLGIWLSVIVDTYRSLTSDRRDRDTALKQTCLVCGLKRTDFEKSAVGFKSHRLLEHNPWNYVFYLINVRTLYRTGVNREVFQRWRGDDLSFVPVRRAISVEAAKAHAADAAAANAAAAK